MANGVLIACERREKIKTLNGCQRAAYRLCGQIWQSYARFTVTLLSYRQSDNRKTDQRHPKTTTLLSRDGIFHLWICPPIAEDKKSYPRPFCHQTTTLLSPNTPKNHDPFVTQTYNITYSITYICKFNVEKLRVKRKFCCHFSLNI